MKLKCIPICELEGFVRSDRYRNAEVLPISVHRALSHARNPRARPDDVALILAYDEKNKLVGYRGILPDTVFIGEKSIRVGWLSCIWVSPKMRGKGIGKQLMEKAFETWNHHLLGTESTPMSMGLYHKTGVFEPLYTGKGMRAYLRLCLSVLLPPKNRNFSRVKWLLKIVDHLFNFFYAFCLLFYDTNLSADITVRHLSEIGEDAEALIKEHGGKTFTRRDRKALNWILKNPWVLSSVFEDADSRRYFFSATDHHFAFVPLQIYRASKLIGVLILSERGGSLKVPYAYFYPEETEAITDVIIKYMLVKQHAMLTIYHPGLCACFQKRRTPFFLKRPFYRYYIISRHIDQSWKQQDIQFQDGDADCAFV